MNVFLPSLKVNADVALDNRTFAAFSRRRRCLTGAWLRHPTQTDTTHAGMPQTVSGSDKRPLSLLLWRNYSQKAELCWLLLAIAGEAPLLSLGDLLHHAVCRISRKFCKESKNTKEAWQLLSQSYSVRFACLQMWHWNSLISPVLSSRAARDSCPLSHLGSRKPWGFVRKSWELWVWG